MGTTTQERHMNIYSIDPIRDLWDKKLRDNGTQKRKQG